MPLKLALAVRGTVAGRRLGALEGGAGVPPPLPTHPWGWDGDGQSPSNSTALAAVRRRAAALAASSDSWGPGGAAAVAEVSHPLVGAVPMMSQRHPFPVSRLSLADETPCVAAQVTGAMALRAPRVRISLPTQSTPG